MTDKDDQDAKKAEQEKIAEAAKKAEAKKQTQEEFDLDVQLVTNRYGEKGEINLSNPNKSALDENAIILGHEIFEHHSPDNDNYFLVDLNETITHLLRADDILKDDKIDIWYDLPETEEKTPDGPTICIYLYDVKENASVRHGGSGTRGYFNPTPVTVAQFGGYFNVQCSYLIIFWDKTSQQLLPNNQNAIIASRIVTALLDKYYIDKIPEYGKFVDYDARFIQGSEQMNSISNFWQSLKQRPRLCLSYEVTVPIRLPIPDKDEVFAVKEETLNIYASQGEPVGKPVDSYVLDLLQPDPNNPNYSKNPLATTSPADSLTFKPKEEPKK